MKSNRRKSRGPVRSDQRTNRSDVPQEAARLYLKAVAERSDVRALALASEEGLLVAGTEGDYDLHGLAALGAACAKSEPDSAHVDSLMDRVVKDEDVYASAVKDRIAAAAPASR